MIYIDYIDYRCLLADASTCKDIDIYVAEHGCQQCMQPLSTKDKLVVLRTIYGIAHKSLTELRALAGVKSRAEMSRLYGIPIRTLESWEAKNQTERREAPGYVMEMISYTVFLRAVNRGEG